jgi:hypothetical protein
MEENEPEPDRETDVAPHDVSMDEVQELNPDDDDEEP